MIKLTNWVNTILNTFLLRTYNWKESITQSDLAEELTFLFTISCYFSVFEEHAECISNQHKMAVDCSKDEAVKYRTMMGAKATYDVLIQANCR